MFEIVSAFKMGKAGIRFLGRLLGTSMRSPSEGFEKLNVALSKLPEEMMHETEKSNALAVANMKADLMVYPPERRNSRYVRTYTLRTGWASAPITTDNVMDGMLGTKVTGIVNPVEYTPWVQQKRTQTGWNKYRWSTVEDVVAKHSPSIISRLGTALDILARSF